MMHDAIVYLAGIQAGVVPKWRVVSYGTRVVHLRSLHKGVEKPVESVTRKWFDSALGERRLVEQTEKA
jgi:hypothetical protein